MDIVCDQFGEIVASVHFADDGANEPSENQMVIAPNIEAMP